MRDISEILYRYCGNENGKGALNAMFNMSPHARLALARALVPEYAVVPREPTEGMVAAGWIDKEDVNPDDIYRAMLAAGEATDDAK